MKTWLEISKKNVLHNVGQFLKLLKPETQFMAVVKSNAYGHGLREVAQITHELKTNGSRIWFGVDNLDEAAVVREIAPRSPVLVLGYTQNARLKEAVKLGARITVYNWETVRALKNVARDFMSRSGGTRGAALRVHVKVETGTTRQGISDKDAVEFVKALKKIRGVEVEGISTHFANSEEVGSKYPDIQAKRYNSLLERLNKAGIEIPVRHTACTAATLVLPRGQANLVRVGIGMYGLWPSEEVRHVIRGSDEMTNRKGIDLKPVLIWKTIVAQVKEVKKGTPVSYDLTERVQRNSRIAVLPVGYYDGYDRGLSGCGEVLINGVRCKVLGRICMNMCMVDITRAGKVQPEDEVVLLGTQKVAARLQPALPQEITAEEIAKKLGTINYEVVTRINPSLPHIIV